MEAITCIRCLATANVDPAYAGGPYHLPEGWIHEGDTALCADCVKAEIEAEDELVLSVFFKRRVASRTRGAVNAS